MQSSKMTTSHFNFNELVKRQIEFQKELFNIKDGLKPVPTYNREQGSFGDCVEWYKYHALALIEEVGELLKSDKRWKTHRNENVDKDEKLDELGDVFISAINIGVFSGFSSEEIYNAISNKIEDNLNRLRLGKKDKR